MNDSVVASMVAGGSLSDDCTRHSSSRSWGVSGDGPALETHKSVKLTVKFFHGHSITASLAVWACVVPAAAMGHPVLVGRDSRVCFSTLVFRTLPAGGPEGCVVGELSLSTSYGVSASASHSSAVGPAFHWRYAGKVPYC